MRWLAVVVTFSTERFDLAGLYQLAAVQKLAKGEACRYASAENRGILRCGTSMTPSCGRSVICHAVGRSSAMLDALGVVIRIQRFLMNACC